MSYRKGRFKLNFKNIQGLNYPDEYFIKFFFKNELHLKRDLTLLELGCSNGNNLTLASSYNHSVVGVDQDKKLIGYAKQNFVSYGSDKCFKFYDMDMRDFCKNKNNINADVLVLANSAYYIPMDDFVNLLRNLVKNRNISAQSLLFLRFRSLGCYRHGRGSKVTENSYILNTEDENGTFCQFYDTETMTKILINELALSDFHALHLRYENIQNNAKVKNHDVVVWGTIN